MLTNKQIGMRIKTTREEKGMTLQEVADMIGVAKSTIQRYEAGLIDNIKLPVISSIASTLGVNPSWLIGKVENRESENSENDFALEGAYFSFAKEMQEKQVSEDDMQKLWAFYEMIKKM